MTSASRVRHCFVVPPLGGPISGGTLYNRELCAALLERSCLLEACALGASRLPTLLREARYVWVDSLYLEALPELKRVASGSVALLTHYLPSFVSRGRAALVVDLDLTERQALEAADSFLVTSHFMRDALSAMLPEKKPIGVVQPGTRARLSPAPPLSPAGLRAVMIANLTSGKGVAPFLRALAPCAHELASFELSIIGSIDADSEYAAACRRVIVDSPLLGQRVRLLGELGHERTLAALAESNLFVSSSAMESYGMALSEARAMGVPILARHGGNAVQHVRREAGGELVNDVAALAAAFTRIASSGAKLQERIDLARQHVPAARPWSEAAREFIDHAERVEK